MILNKLKTFSNFIIGFLLIVLSFFLINILFYNPSNWWINLNYIFRNFYLLFSSFIVFLIAMLGTTRLNKFYDNIMGISKKNEITFKSSVNLGDYVYQYFYSPDENMIIIDRKRIKRIVFTKDGVFTQDEDFHNLDKFNSEWAMIDLQDTIEKAKEEYPDLQLKFNFYKDE